MERPAAAAQARVGDVSSVAHESFEGALLVKTLGLEDARSNACASGPRISGARLVVGRLRAGFEPGLDALPNLGHRPALAGRLAGVHRRDHTGELVQAMALFAILAFPFRIVGFLLEELPRAVVAHDRITGVLAAPVRHEPTDPSPLPAGPSRWSSRTSASATTTAVRSSTG